MMKTVPLLQHLYPRSDQRRASDHFDVNGSKPSDSPNVYSAGIGTGLAGFRATIVISDDIETIQNSRTPDARETLVSFFNEATNLLFADEEGNSGETIILGTYQSMDSIYKQLEPNGYKICIIPARYPMNNNNKYGKKLASYLIQRLKDFPSFAGKAIDTRFNEEVLAKRLLKIGKSAFNLQYLLDPSDSDEMKYPLKLSDLITMDIDSEDMPMKIYYSSTNKVHIYHNGFSTDYLVQPQDVSKERDEFSFTLMSIDPAGRGADKTGYAIASILNGRIFLRAFGSADGGYSDASLIGLAEIAKMYGVNIIYPESNFGDGAFTELLKPHLERIHPCAVEEVRASTMKEARIIETLEPIMNQHKLIVDKTALQIDSKVRQSHSLTYQLTHIAKEKGCLQHDDVLDAVEIAVSKAIVYMAIDEDKAISQHKEEEIRKANQVINDLWFQNSSSGMNYF